MNNIGFTNVMCVLGRCYAFKGLFDNEDITDKITHVALLENYGKGNNSLVDLKKTLLYTVAGGPLGFLCSLGNTTKVHISCIIYLNDDRTIELETKDEKLVKFLFQFMNVYKKRR